jgi:hypothetical protein
MNQYESDNKLGLCPIKERLRIFWEGDLVKIRNGSNKDNNEGYFQCCI